MARNSQYLADNHGGSIEVKNDRHDGTWICWSNCNGKFYGISQNNHRLRSFLRRTLKRLDKAAAKDRKLRSKKH